MCIDEVVQRIAQGELGVYISIYSRNTLKKKGAVCNVNNYHLCMLKIHALFLCAYIIYRGDFLD